jgi:hypothetical protein
MIIRHENFNAPDYREHFDKYPQSEDDWRLQRRINPKRHSKTWWIIKVNKRHYGRSDGARFLYENIEEI